MNAANELDLGDDLVISRIEARANAPGTWANGTIAGHKFNALVFPQHPDNPDYEIDGSRISKLWIQRISDHTTVFNWDRGLDVGATNDEAQAIVDFLAAGLADHVEHLTAE